MFAFDAFEGVVMLVLYFVLGEVRWFLFVFGEGFESEHAEGV